MTQATASAIGCPFPHATQGIQRSHADMVVRKLLRVREQPNVQSAHSAVKAFRRSMVISTIRCTLTYLVFPFALPALGLMADTGVVLSIVIGTLASQPRPQPHPSNGRGPTSHPRRDEKILHPSHRSSHPPDHSRNRSCGSDKPEPAPTGDVHRDSLKRHRRATTRPFGPRAKMLSCPNLQASAVSVTGFEVAGTATTLATYSSAPNAKPTPGSSSRSRTAFGAKQAR